MLDGSLGSPRTKGRRLPITAALALIAVLALCLWSGPVLANGDNGDDDETEFGVMSRNIYLGADLTPAIAAPNPPAFFAANGGILRQVTRTNFPLRAKALAGEILNSKPDLVGLQEVALWRDAKPASLDPVFNGPSATHVRYDFLRLLLNQLNKNGQVYRAVVVQKEFDFEAPADENGRPNDGPGGVLANTEINGRLTMRDVILARQGTAVTNPRKGNFRNLLVVRVANAVDVPVTRGWTALDARVDGGRKFHFVNTHLEAFDDETQRPSIRAKQARELVTPGGPARSSLPVILAGDLNSNSPGVQPGDEQAYLVMRGAGFVNRDTSNPLSCCINDPNLVAGTVADFDHKVDHILTSSPGKVELEKARVTGRAKFGGLWPSDHAGLFSELELED